MHKLFYWFDYVYYRVYLHYTNSIENDMPAWYANGVLAIVIGANLSVILFVIDILNRQTVVNKVSKLHVAIFFIVILIMNLIRYNKKRQITLVNRWNNEKNKRLKGVFVISYIVLSLLAFLITAIILGEINR